MKPDNKDTNNILIAIRVSKGISELGIAVSIMFLISRGAIIPHKDTPRMHNKIDVAFHRYGVK